MRVLDRSGTIPRDPAWPSTVDFRCGDDRSESLDGVDLVVPSPGVPQDHPLLREAVARRIRV